MTSITSITSRDLLRLVGPYQPVVDGKELAFNLDLPDELIAHLSVLHTGVRAVLTRRQWWGSADCNAKRPQVARIDAHKPIPDWCGLLCVTGDTQWDRIHPAARVDYPELFQQPPMRSEARG